MLTNYHNNKMLYNTFTDKLINKFKNNITLDYGEKYIIQKYISYLNTNIFDLPNSTTIFENIKLELLTNKNYIIKLIFSNTSSCIHTPINILYNIEYFKNMFDGHNFGDDIIVEIIMNESVDDYNIMNNIISFLSGVNINNPLNCVTMFKTIIMLDYVGPIVFNNINMMQMVIVNGIMKCDDIKDFEDYENYIENNVDKTIINITNIEKIYNILDQNKIIKYKDVLMIMIINANDNNIESSMLFDKIIINTNYGKRYICNNNLIKYYPKIFNDFNYKHIMESLLKENTIECWNIIMEIIKIKPIQVNKWLFKKFDMITELVFDYDITQFDTIIQLKLMIKFNRIEYIDNIGDNIIKLSKGSHHNLKELFTNYLDTLNKGDGDKFKNTNKLSPKNYYCGYRYFAQVISYTPFICKEWTQIGTIKNKFTNNNLVTLIIEIRLPITHKINNQTKLLINFKDNMPYNIINIDHLLLPYYDNNNIKYVPIDNIFSNIDNQYTSYCIVYDLNINKNIDINNKDNVYI